MNTYLFQNDNSIILTESTGAITERSNSVDTLRIVVPKLYNETFDMSEFNGLFEYKLPISNASGLFELVLADDNYKEDYLLYTLPDTVLTTDLTKEVGNVEFSLTFAKAELDEEGNTIERIRQSAGHAVLKIIPIASWLTPSDKEISTLASMYIENKKVALALADLAATLGNTKLDDLIVNTDDNRLYGTANGAITGEGVDLATLNQILVRLGGSAADNGNIHIQQI